MKGLIRFLKPGAVLVFFLLHLLLFPVFFVHAQAPDADADSKDSLFEEEILSEDTETDESAEAAKTDADYIEMDIKTSTLMELAVWCRELGLSEGGTREELATRLRSYYQVASSLTGTEGQRVITIESAKTTEYFTLDVVDEEYARLKGDVILSLKDGNAVHRIKAWEILYNRTRNVITASGKVEYVKEEGDTIETFKGESITVNLDNWSSIFMDGVSERSKAGNTTAYRFAGTVISRNSEEVTVLTGADITNPNNEEAFWSLHASKLWLLPGNDWAILNAVLKVGNIPLLYLPFFYYPSDEIIFHPVLGVRTREGTFLQTTTYILGRPKTEAISENSITKIFGSASENMEKKREGVFLRSTGEKRVDLNEKRLSILFDAYVNLGAYLGAELALPAKGAFGEFSLSAGIGITRNIFPTSDGYTPFKSGESEWVFNDGHNMKFFTLDVPFRYRLNMTGSFKIKNDTFSWFFPFYSDLFVDRDFMRRTEVLDWLSMLREGASASDDDTSANYKNSYEWRLNGSYNPQIPKLAPYISSLSFSNISSSLLFMSNGSTGSTTDNPDNTFFYPKTFTIYSISAAMRGTPYKSGISEERQPRSPGDPAPGDSLLPDFPVSPWEESGRISGGQAPSGSGSGSSARDTADTNPSDNGPYDYLPPVLGQKFSLGSIGGPKFTFDYRLAPNAVMTEEFKPASGTDVSWEALSILSKVQADGNFNFKVEHTAFNSTFGLSGTGVWLEYVLHEGDDAAKDLAKLKADEETKFSSSWIFSASVTPFFQSAVWGKTSFSYSLAGLLASNSVAASGDREWNFADWNADKISTSQVIASFAANIRDYDQSFTITAVLPPKDSSIKAEANFRAWITTTKISGGLKNPWEKAEWVFDPITITETLKFGTIAEFTQYVVFDPEKDDFTTLTSTLRFPGIGINASYSMAYLKPWIFNNGWNDPMAADQRLWIQRNDYAFRPNDLKLGYTKTFTPWLFWKNRFALSFKIDTNLRFDLQQYTNSKFDFNLGLKIGIMNFLDLEFTTQSENKVIYKYIMSWFGPHPSGLYENAETNIFIDLFNSFRFDDADKRKSSGFKLKSLDLSLVHHLGDWNAKLTVSMTPDLNKTSAHYSWYFKNEVSFLIMWVPIGEIKAQLDYKEDYTGSSLTVK